MRWRVRAVRARVTAGTSLADAFTAIQRTAVVQGRLTGLLAHHN
jgi:hypothetical protein